MQGDPVAGCGDFPDKFGPPGFIGSQHKKGCAGVEIGKDIKELRCYSGIGTVIVCKIDPIFRSISAAYCAGQKSPPAQIFEVLPW